MNWVKCSERLPSERMGVREYLLKASSGHVFKGKPKDINAYDPFFTNARTLFAAFVIDEDNWVSFNNIVEWCELPDPADEEIEEKSGPGIIPGGPKDTKGQFRQYLDGYISHERLAEILGISQSDLKIVTDKLR